VAARLKERYQDTVRDEMLGQFNYGNVMQVPKLVKIVVNMGVGDGQSEPRLLDAAMAELGLITGQKPSIRTARHSIAGFKLREGAKIAAMTTLRGEWTAS